MGIWTDQILPRLIDFGMDQKFYADLRKKAVRGLRGTVLEVGFGSGLNLPFLPPEVERVLAVDPAKVGKTLARTRLAHSPIPVRFIGLNGERLPLEDDSVDSALSTWTLCTIPDVGRALREIARVLRPGGRLHFSEHGLAPDEKIRRWQEKMNPLQRFLCGGCNLNRAIDRLIEENGFKFESIDRSYGVGPKAHSYLYRGIAVSAGI